MIALLRYVHITTKHLNGLNLQPIQLLEAIVSSSISSQIYFECIEDHPLPLTPLYYYRTKAPVTFTLHLRFM